MRETPSKKIKQIDLAKRSDISPSYLNDIIKKRNPGSDDAHRKIAAALGFPGRKYEDFLDIGRAITAERSDFSLPDIRPGELEDGVEDFEPDDTDAEAPGEDIFSSLPAERRYFYLALNHLIPRRNRAARAKAAQKALVGQAVIDGILERRDWPASEVRRKIAAAFDMTLDGFLLMGKGIDDEVALQMMNFSPDAAQEPPAADVEAEEGGLYAHILNQAAGGSPASASSMRPLPMLGLAYCGYEGWKTVMPISVSASPITLGPRAFAVAIDGLSMLPEGLGPGMICYCDPDQIPLPGDAIYVGAGRAEGGSLGSIKKYLGKGPEVELPEGWIKVRGWKDPDKRRRQASYVINIPPHQIMIVATVIYVRRRL